MSDNHYGIRPEDYMEPRCVLCGDPYGQTPQVKSVPQQRIIQKMDEYMAKRDYAGAERHLLYWMEEAKLGQDLRGQLMLHNELIGQTTGKKPCSISIRRLRLSKIWISGKHSPQAPPT